MMQHNNATLRGGSPDPPRALPPRPLGAVSGKGDCTLFALLRKGDCPLCPAGNGCSPLFLGARRVRRPAALNTKSSSSQGARPGFSLIEAVISTLIVAILMVASLTVLGASRAGQLKIADRARGEQLAIELMNEVLQGDYMELYYPPLFGPEGIEIGAGRMYFDDIDDYAAWTESPPQTRGGVPLPDFTGWTRSVAVEWVNPNNLTQASTTATDVKRITVTVLHGDARVARVVALRSIGWAQAVPAYQDATGNRPPRAIAWTASSKAKVSTVVSFDGRNSTDPNSDALTYAWNFGDSATATGSTATHTYAAAGTYTVTLTVRDGRGGVDTDRLLITITT